jgi:O-antigen ligase
MTFSRQGRVEQSPRRAEQWLCSPWNSARVENRDVRFRAKTDSSSALSKLAFASLWLLVFTIPWEDAITIPGFGTSARLIGILAASLGLLAIIERGKVRRPAPSHVLMALVVLLATASYLWSLYPEGTSVQIVSYVQLFLMVWLIWELATQGCEQMMLMQAYILGTFVSGVDTIYLFLTHHESAYQRYAGAGLDANDLGLMMALSIPISYYLLLRSKGWKSWIYRLQLVLAGSTIILTASRGAALASLVALAIIPLTSSSLPGRKRIAVLLTVPLLVCAAALFAPETSWERLSTTPTEFEHGTLTGRTVIWKAGWEIFRAHPFLGVGANAFRPIVARVLAEPIRLDQQAYPPAPPAHNTFLSVLVEEGVVGLAIFCALLWVLAASIRAMPKLPRRLWTLTLVVWMVGVSSLTWEMRKPTWLLFGLIVAQCNCLEQRRPKRPKLADAVALPESKGLSFHQAHGAPPLRFAAWRELPGSQELH